MSGVRFSKEEIETFMRKLNSTGMNNCCTNPKKEILAEVFRLPFLANEMPAPGLDLATVVCYECGRVDLFSPNVLGGHLEQQ